MSLAIVSVLICAPMLAVEPVVERAKQPVTLYALGDIHGDYQRLIVLLRGAGLIDKNNNWSAGASTLVVTGDMIDKGPEPVNAIRFLTALKVSAASHGGEVILLAGNHEAEFLAAPDPIKAEAFLEDLKRHNIRTEDVVACRGDIGAALCSLPFAARIGDWFFSHAGNTAGRTLPKIKADLQAGFAAQRYTSPQFLAPDSILEARLTETEQWISVPGIRQQSLLESYTKALGVKHIVQGHQHNAIVFDDGIARGLGEMFQRWGLLFLIDVGMSRDIGDSEGAVLEIRGNAATAICPSGKRTLLWSQFTGEAIGRAAVCGISNPVVKPALVPKPHP